MTAEQQAIVDTLKIILASMESQQRSTDMIMEVVKDLAAAMDRRISNIETIMQETGMAMWAPSETVQ